MKWGRVLFVVNAWFWIFVITVAFWVLVGYLIGYAFGWC